VGYVREIPNEGSRSAVGELWKLSSSVDARALQPRIVRRSPRAGLERFFDAHAPRYGAGSF